MKIQVACGESEAIGWVLYMLAKEREVEVTPPKHNGYGRYFMSLEVADDVSREGAE